MIEAEATVMQLLLLAGIVLGTVVAKGVLAAERGLTNVPAPGISKQSHRRFRPSPRARRALPPVFNQSSPYTVPQSLERPGSPARPGSVFGDH
jgi:hypothetical protein